MCTSCPTSFSVRLLTSAGSGSSKSHTIWRSSSKEGQLMSPPERAWLLVLKFLHLSLRASFSISSLRTNVLLIPVSGLNLSPILQRSLLFTDWTALLDQMTTLKNKKLQLKYTLNSETKCKMYLKVTSSKPNIINVQNNSRNVEPLYTSTTLLCTDPDLQQERLNSTLGWL